MWPVGGGQQTADFGSAFEVNFGHVKFSPRGLETGKTKKRKQRGKKEKCVAHCEGNVAVSLVQEVEKGKKRWREQRVLGAVYGRASVQSVLDRLEFKRGAGQCEALQRDFPRHFALPAASPFWCSSLLLENVFCSPPAVWTSSARDSMFRHWEDGRTGGITGSAMTFPVSFRSGG